MAIWTYTRQADWAADTTGAPLTGVFSLVPTTATATTLEFSVTQDGVTQTLTFAGSGLSYIKSLGRITDILSGTITSIRSAEDGVVWSAGTGLSISAAAMFDAAVSGSAAAQQALFLGANDVIRATDTADGDILLAGAGADTIFGFGGADSLNGQSGADVLHGGKGDDVLVGGAGADTFVFDTRLSGRSNVDQIQDFSRNGDLIALDDAIFRGLAGTGALDAEAFHSGTRAQDAADRILYDRASGTIYYDRDGAGGDGKVLFAIVNKGQMLDHSDFVIV